MDNGTIYVIILGIPNPVDDSDDRFKILATTTDEKTAIKYRDTFNEDSLLVLGREDLTQKDLDGFVAEWGFYPSSVPCRICRYSNIFLGLKEM